MYYLINQNINVILNHLREMNVMGYDWLVENLIIMNVENNNEYQRRYKNYWKMNQARLAQPFYNEYFHLLELNKDSPEVSIENICRTLSDVAVHINRQTLQFSFTTKLVHMINRSKPIYDRMVRAFYFLPETNRRQQFDERLNNCLLSFNFLCREYERVIREHILTDSIMRFRYEFQPAHFTDVRIIDSLIWAFVNLARQGRFRDQTFLHQ